MRKLLLLLIIPLLFACEEKKEPFKVDPDAMITIRPAKGVQLRPTDRMKVKVQGLTALEIVQQARSTRYQSRYFDDMDVGELRNVARGFNEETMKDFDIPALKMLGIDVINAQGEYIRDFTHATNVFITTENNDTIAFVPDTVISNARPLIEAAYQNRDYEEVYRLFDEAFTFLPIE